MKTCCRGGEKMFQQNYVHVTRTAVERAIRAKRVSAYDC